MSPRVVVDTSVLWAGSRLNAKTIRALVRLRQERRIAISVPELVLLELERHLKEAATKAEQGLASLRASADVLEVNSFELDSNFGAVDWDEAIRKVICRFADIHATPKVPHLDLLKRDLARRRPFKENGQGYRDALIWETVLELIAPDRATVLLTANKNDFGAGDPHPHLRQDVKAGATVIVLETADALATWLNDPSAPLGRSRYRGYATSPVPEGSLISEIVGYASSHIRNVRFGARLTLDGELEHVHDGSVYDVTEYESDDDYGLFEAVISSEADVSTEISRSQLGLVDDDVRIGQVEPGEDSVWISATRPVLLTVNVSYRLDTLEIDNVDVLEAEFNTDGD